MQARKIRRCYNKRDDCVAHDVLVSSLNVTEKIPEDKREQKKTDRLLINPEFVESTDTSDGSEMFSPEDRKIEEEATRLDY